MTQHIEVSVNVKNPPPDARVTLTLDGREITSNTLMDSSFQLAVPGAAKPGAVEVTATSGGVSGTATVQFKPCPPACSMAGLGVKVALDRDEGDTSLFGDVAVNGLVGRGFLGAGLSFWDLTESDTRAAGLLVQGGADLTRDGRWQDVGQARAPFGELDDLDNNYQLRGGIRFRPDSWR